MIEKVLELIKSNSEISDYTINCCMKDSILTDYIDVVQVSKKRAHLNQIEVTIYKDHDEYRGHSSFTISSNVSEEEINELIELALKRALLVKEKYFPLPENSCVQRGRIESHLDDFLINELILEMVKTIKAQEMAKFNDIKIELNRYENRFISSTGIDYYTYKNTILITFTILCRANNKEVELTKELKTAFIKSEDLKEEVSQLFGFAFNRIFAIQLYNLETKVAFLSKEIYKIFKPIVDDLNYEALYNKTNKLKIKDKIQKNGDLINIKVNPTQAGSIDNETIDPYGAVQKSVSVIKNGVVKKNFGSSKYAYYLNQPATGSPNNIELKVRNTTLSGDDQYLMLIDFSVFEVDFYNDYIGGVVTMAFNNDGFQFRSFTNFSFRAKYSEILDGIKFTDHIVYDNNYIGPALMVVKNVKLFGGNYEKRQKKTKKPSEG